MKSNYLISIFLAIFIGLIPLAHAKSDADNTTIEAVNQETQELLKTLKQYGSNKRDEAIKKTQEAMTKLDQRLNRLETRINNNWDQMDEAARIKARSTMKALRQKRIELAESFGSWKTSSASAWEHMKEGFSEAYQDLQKSWNKAKTEFSSNNE